MNDRSQQQTRAFDVCVEFQSDGATYAQESYQIEALDEYDAERLARERAEDSAYYDPRVPDLGLHVTVEAEGPTGPDTDPASPAQVRVRPICPKCGSADIVKDASAQWDEENQCWSLSGTYDGETCQACDAEGDDLSTFMPIEPPIAVGMRVRIRPRPRIGGDPFAGREGEVVRVGSFGP